MKTGDAVWRLSPAGVEFKRGRTSSSHLRKQMPFALHVAANEYRNTEIHGNAYRHPEKYQCLTEQRICAPFIRPDYRN